jgi:hypothetical protein
MVRSPKGGPYLNVVEMLSILPIGEVGFETLVMKTKSLFVMSKTSKWSMQFVNRGAEHAGSGA